MSDQPQWHFPKYQIGHILQDPTQSEFFTADSVGGLSKALVREAIQNTLDARISAGTKVGIRFALKDVPLQSARLFFGDLPQHLMHAVGKKLPHQDKLRVLVIEDYRAKGLIGNYRTIYEQDGESENNFFYFWRNVGRSGKTESDRGRWGLGKSIFAAVSEISTFFGVTVRHGDPKQEFLLMGQSVLKHHTLSDGQHYTPYGHYGVFEPEQPDFALPVRDANLIHDFCAVFDLDRGRNRTKDGKWIPGLSLVIPLPDSDITEDSLLLAAVDQYFYPIMQKRLFIRMDKDDVEAAELPGIVAQKVKDEVERQRYLGLFRFTSWAQQLPDEEFIELPTRKDLHAAPTWNESYRDRCADEMEVAREKLWADKRVALTIPVRVAHFAREAGTIARFKLFLEVDSSIGSAENYFIREGITVTGIRTLTQRGLRGMVVIEKLPLATMLGDAENPAHTEWHKDSLKFKGKYDNGPYTLSFVKSSLKAIAQELTKVAKDFDEEILKDIFSFVERAAESPTTTRRVQGKNRGDTTDEAPELDIEGRDSPVTISRLEDGVQIASPGRLQEPGQNVMLWFAYDVHNGDPFKKYDIADFDLANDRSLLIYGEGVKFLKRELNFVEFLVDSVPYKVVVQGFDWHRDVKVKARWE